MDNIEDFTQGLIETAENGIHGKIEKIKYFKEYLVARETKHALYKVAKSFEKAAKICVEDYIKTGDLKSLFQARTMENCCNFYTEEFNQMKQSIHEYNKYLFDGDLIGILTGNEREDA